MSLPIEEQWQPLPGYEDRYEVSDLGNVRPLPGVGRGRVFAQSIGRGGYKAICLYAGQYKRQNLDTHVLVCIAFHGPRPFPGAVVRHLNDVHTDNRAANLAWGTQRQNLLDAVRNGKNWNTTRTQCKYGHPLDGSYRTKDGKVQRRCLTCHRAKQAARKAAQRANVARTVGDRPCP